MPNSIKKIIVGIILVGITAPSLFLVSPQPVKAFPVGIPVFETGALKEGPLDIIAYTIAKQFLRLLMREIIGWVQTGDIYGGPLFIQNFENFFSQTRHDASSIFISAFREPATQAGIASPFRDSVTQSITSVLNTPSALSPSTLVGILPDERPFYEDYNTGSLIGLYNILTVPQNHVGGQFLRSLNDAGRYAAQREFADQTETLASGGYQGYADCIGWIDDLATGRNVCIGRAIKTAGSNAQNLLSSVLESDLDVLESADEIAEIIGVIIGRLMTSILDFDLSDSSIDPFAGTYRPVPGDGQPIPGDPGPDGCAPTNLFPLTYPSSCPPGGGGGGSTPAGGLATASPICLTNGPAVVTIRWNIDTGNVTNTLGYVRYCTGQACVPTTSSPVACIGTTSCVHTGVTPGGTYTYKVFVYETLAGPTGTPLTTSTNIPSATALTCN